MAMVPEKSKLLGPGLLLSRKRAHRVSYETGKLSGPFIPWLKTRGFLAESVTISALLRTFPSV
jgi:hypothetical protein